MQIKPDPHWRTSPDRCLPQTPEEDHANAVAIATMAVVYELTMAEVKHLSTGLDRFVVGVHGEVTTEPLYAAIYNEDFAAVGAELLRLHLILQVAPPLAVYRITGEPDEDWIASVEDPVFDTPYDEVQHNTGERFERAQKLSDLLGLTMAEAVEMGEAFLDEPGVQDAIERVADALFEVGYLDRAAFLAAAQPPAEAQERREAFEEKAKEAHRRYFLRRL